MLSNTCKKANNESTEIEYVCIFPNSSILDHFVINA